MSDDTKKPGALGRRGLIKGLGAAATAAAFPTLWLPNKAYAQTAARGEVEHLIYIRLAGGFRFTTAFNGDVADSFNPFGKLLLAGRGHGVGRQLHAGACLLARGHRGRAPGWTWA